MKREWKYQINNYLQQEPLAISMSTYTQRTSCIITLFNN